MTPILAQYVSENLEAERVNLDKGRRQVRFEDATSSNGLIKEAYLFSANAKLGEIYKRPEKCESTQWSV